jgi:hypothetical protein
VYAEPAVACVALNQLLVRSARILSQEEAFFGHACVVDLRYLSEYCFRLAYMYRSEPHNLKTNTSLGPDP